jgi:hypothetical protein
VSSGECRVRECRVRSEEWRVTRGVHYSHLTTHYTTHYSPCRPSSAGPRSEYGHNCTRRSTGSRIHFLERKRKREIMNR